MNKLLYIFIAVIIASVAGTFVVQTWRSTAYVRTEGRGGTVVIDEHDDIAHRTATPLPLKTLRIYTATLAPNHAVQIESDQHLVAGGEYDIRFLAYDQVQAMPASFLRPIPGTIHPLNNAADTVPFLLVDANDGMMEILWENSRIGEWLAVAGALLVSTFLLIHALALPGRVRPRPSERKDFVHPSLRKIDPDPPPPPPAPIPLPPKPVAVSGPAPVPVAEPILKLPRHKTREPDSPHERVPESPV
jgi:hypothetical protein